MVINMVSSLDGKVTTNSGKAGSIGSPVDRLVMCSLRSRVDAVMIGASTLRAEKLNLSVPEDLTRTRVSQGRKPQPLAVLVSASGDLPLEENLLGPSREDRLVFTVPCIPGERLATLSQLASVETLPAEGDSIHLRTALNVLKARHEVAVLLVEGGPSLNYSLVRGGLVDEIFLTLAPKLTGGQGPSFPGILHGPALPPEIDFSTDLISIHASHGELFLRYHLKTDPTNKVAPDPNRV